MGASESLLARQPQQQSQWADEITTVSDGRRDAADEDPLLRRIRSLTIVRTNLPQSFSPRCGFFTANFTLWLGFFQGPAAAERSASSGLGDGDKLHWHPCPETCYCVLCRLRWVSAMLQFWLQYPKGTVVEWFMYFRVGICWWKPILVIGQKISSSSSMFW
jgi:hypothetical protein